MHPINILLALVVITFNVLDSVTTNLCFKQYPDKELKSEANPFMRRLMLKNRALAEVVKQVFVTAIVIYYVVANHTEPLKFLSIMFGLVVLNNSYIYLSRKITKRKVVSPLERLRQFIHLPNSLSYALVMILIFGLSIIIYSFIGGL